MIIYSTSAWFGDLKDGIHKGDQHDPRVAVIQVIPDEIRYWTVTKNAAARAVDIATSAVTGNAASPGELRTITKAEVSRARFSRAARSLNDGYRSS